MFNFFLYKIGQTLATILPIKLGYTVAVILADLQRILSAKDRSAVMDNLRKVLPGADEETLKGHCRQAFRNFAKYLIDFFRFEKIDKNYIAKNVAGLNFDIIDKALAKNKGVIIVSAHIANWELAGITMALSGYPISCVALTHRNKAIDNFFINQRQQKGMGVIPLGNAAFRCLQALRKNKLVALVGDRDFSQSGIQLDFFGVPTFIPKGPAAFSLMTGAPLVVGIIIRQSDDTFEFTYEGPLEIEKTGDGELDIKKLSQMYVRVIERYIKDYPGQWLMFRRFWEPVDKNACE